jgi:hypothetical protein
MEATLRVLRALRVRHLLLADVMNRDASLYFRRRT